MSLVLIEWCCLAMIFLSWNDRHLISGEVVSADYIFNCSMLGSV